MTENLNSIIFWKMHVSTLPEFLAKVLLMATLTVWLSACGGAEEAGGTSVPADVQTVTWADLRAVKFEDRFYPDLEEYLLYPNFEPSVQALDGEGIRIEGYVIPVEPGRYVLSANPFSSCFFCGGAGPESVIELELIQPGAMYVTDEFKTFTGILSLNDSDVDKLNYVLHDAVAE